MVKQGLTLLAFKPDCCIFQNGMNISDLLALLRKRADGILFFMLTVLESLRKRRGREVREILKAKLKMGDPNTPSRQADVLAACKKFAADYGYKLPDYLLEALVRWVFEDSKRIQKEELIKGDGE